MDIKKDTTLSISDRSEHFPHDGALLRISKNIIIITFTIFGCANYLFLFLLAIIEL